MRTLALGILLLATAGVAHAGDKRPRAAWTLPRALSTHGFGERGVPVTVTFTSPSGETSARPVHHKTGVSLPHNTQWVFRNPAPVWKALAGAQTRRFLPDMFPGADARITIRADADGERRAIHLHYRQGHGDISVRRISPRGRSKGGAWEFDPAADRALIALLSRTQPTYVGVPALGVFQMHAVPRGDVPLVQRIESAAGFEKLKASLRFRYPRTSAWKMPKGFDWKTHFLFLAQTPMTLGRKKLDWSNARLRRGVLSWELRLRDDDRGSRPASMVSALLGVFPRQAGLTHLRADIAGYAQVECRAVKGDDDRTPQADTVFLQIDERFRKGKLWAAGARTLVRFGGRYTRWSAASDPGAGAVTLHGTIPPQLCMRLRQSFRAAPEAFAAAEGRAKPKTFVLHLDDAKSKKPDGVQDLVDYIARVHGGP